MDRAAMKAQLRRRFNAETGDSTLDTMLEDALSAAYGWVTGLLNWPLLEAAWTATTANGDTEITLPSDFGAMKLVHLYTSETDYGPLEGTTWEKEVNNNGYPSTYTGGRPERYVLHGVADGALGARKWKMTPFPYPTDVYTIAGIYIVDPGDFSADTDVPWFPWNYHSILVNEAYVQLGGYSGGMDVNLAAKSRDQALQAMAFRQDAQDDWAAAVPLVGG